MLDLSPIRRKEWERAYHSYARQKVHEELEKYKYKWADGYKGDKEAKIEVLHTYIDRLHRDLCVAKNPETKRFYKIAIDVAMDAISWIEGRSY